MSTLSARKAITDLAMLHHQFLALRKQAFAALRDLPKNDPLIKRINQCDNNFIRKLNHWPNDLITSKWGTLNKQLEKLEGE